MIKFDQISKTFEDGYDALKNINFSVQEGELFTLIGPSGCGKTTTMKMINRLIEPSEGSIFIDDQDISKINPVKLRRKIGYVIQQIGLFPHMTIAQNISIVPKLNKWPKENYEKRVDELLDLVGLDPSIFRSRYPLELSGGQQQRIGVVRALAAEPPVVLMDEPFSALDPISREQLQDELLRLQKEIKKTIVFVTHDMDEAIKISDRIALMRQGQIVQLDTPKSILEQPKNDFVIDFIGEKRLEGHREHLTAYEVMEKDFLSIKDNQSVNAAAELMNQQNKDYIIVLNQLEQCEGILRLSDIVQQAGTMLEQMVRPPKQPVELHTPIEKIAKIFIDHNEPVPVLSNNKVVGVITVKSVMGKLAGKEGGQ